METNQGSLSHSLLSSSSSPWRKAVKDYAWLFCAVVSIFVIGSVLLTFGIIQELEPDGAAKVNYHERDGLSKPLELAEANAMMTSQITLTKETYDVAISKVGLDRPKAEELWTELAGGSSLRIIKGATAPRDDAANVNNWHWTSVDVLDWCRTRLRQLLVPIKTVPQPDKSWVGITNVTSVDGEASISNRKGKKIVTFELHVKCEWRGSINFDDVRGKLELPYVSEDVGDDEYEIKLISSRDTHKGHQRAVSEMRTLFPSIQKAVHQFASEIFEKEVVKRSDSTPGLAEAAAEMKRLDTSPDA